MPTDPALGIFHGQAEAEAKEDAPTVSISEVSERNLRAAKLSASKPLPSPRIPFTKQLEILCGHVVASQRGQVPVGNVELSRVVGMHTNNVSPANPFFSSIGLIVKSGHGYLPSDVAVQYQHEFNWSPETAGLKLAPLLAQSWFGQIVEQQLQLRSRSEKEVINAFASASNAPKDAVPSLQMLLEYLKYSGLITVEDGMVKRGQSEEAGSQSAPDGGTPVSPPPASPPPAKLPTPKRTTMGDGGSGQGVRFTIDVDVSMQEIAGWTPDRIAAFFTGVAQVISAKNGGSSVNTD